MKEQKIKVLLLEPNKSPEPMEIDNTLETFQKLVEGYIEIVPLQENSKVFIVLNDEGKLLGLEPNFFWYNDIIVGNAVFVRSNGMGDFTNLTNEDLEEIYNFLDIDEDEEIYFAKEE